MSAFVPDSVVEVAAKLRKEGNEFYAASRWDEAICAYTEAVNLDPNSHTALSNRCAAKLKIGDVESAIQDARGVIKLAPTWPKGYIRLAEGLREANGTKNAKEAVKCLEKARELGDCEEYRKIELKLKAQVHCHEVTDLSSRKLLKTMELTLEDIGLDEEATFREIHPRLCELENSDDPKMIAAFARKKAYEDELAAARHTDHIDFYAKAKVMPLRPNCCLTLTFCHTDTVLPNAGGKKQVINTVVDNITGCTRAMETSAGEPLSADRALRLLLKGMTMPMRSSGPPFKPDCVLIAHRFKDAHPVISQACRELGVYAHLETYAAACESARGAGTHPMGLMERVF